MTSPLDRAPEYVPNSRLLDLTGKSAIVTGGAQGIGFGICRRLAEAGAAVTIADIAGAQGKKAVARLAEWGARAQFVRCDVSKEADIADMVAATARAHGGVDIVVNNAGHKTPGSPTKHVLEMEQSLWDTMHAVNLRAHFLVSREAAKQMIAQGRGGRIVNIASLSAYRPGSVGLAHYAASKGGVVSLMKGLALDLSPHKILVNCVTPGTTKTEGSDPFWQSLDAKTREKLLWRLALDRLGYPDDIAKAVLFLASEMGAYITGQVVVVDGGNQLF